MRELAAKIMHAMSSHFLKLEVEAAHPLLLKLCLAGLQLYIPVYFNLLLTASKNFFDMCIGMKIMKFAYQYKAANCLKFSQST